VSHASAWTGKKAPGLSRQKSQGYNRATDKDQMSDEGRLPKTPQRQCRKALEWLILTQHCCMNTHSPGNTTVEQPGPKMITALVQALAHLHKIKPCKMQCFQEQSVSSVTTTKDFHRLFKTRIQVKGQGSTVYLRCGQDPSSPHFLGMTDKSQVGANPPSKAAEAQRKPPHHSNYQLFFCLQ